MYVHKLYVLISVVLPKLCILRVKSSFVMLLCVASHVGTHPLLLCVVSYVGKGAKVCHGDGTFCER